MPNSVSCSSCCTPTTHNIRPGMRLPKCGKQITEAIADARKGKLDLSNRWESDAAKTTLKGTLAVRAALEAQWFNE
jgi:hypothetical protein